jgi:hypothetical protein
MCGHVNILLHYQISNYTVKHFTNCDTYHIIFVLQLSCNGKVHSTKKKKVVVPPPLIKYYRRCFSFERQNIKKSRDSSVGIALGYGLDDRGYRVRFPARAGNFPIHRRVQKGSGAHPASYPLCTGRSFPGVKAAGA